ncbi:hypothetical protein JCM10449v2_000240 [Rhodotorula kratochvilovae]
MFASLAITALAGLTAVRGVPLPQLAQLATVEAALSAPNATHYNASVSPYEMNGKAGACGWYNQDEQAVVGLPLEEYTDLSSVSPYCGAFVVVVDPKTNVSVTALVADASTQNETLSVSQGTFAALNGTDSELKFVDWRFANETETAAAKEALQSGSSSSAAAPSSSAASTSSAAQQQQEEEKAAPSTSSSAKPTTTSSAYQAPATTSAAPKATTTTTQAPKPTTTQAAETKQAQAAYKESSSSSSGSGSSYSGQATYYFQGGAAGSCGNYASDSDYVVAVNAPQMNSGWCGRSVKITNTANGKTISAKVADTCPGCGHGSLDLSEGAFGALGSYSSGVLPISWSFN